jgi:hypothetical protein
MQRPVLLSDSSSSSPVICEADFATPLCVRSSVYRGPETQVLRAKYRGLETSKFLGCGFQDVGSQFWDLDFTQGASQWPSAMGTH